jgi:hypothetical protein
MQKSISRTRLFFIILAAAGNVASIAGMFAAAGLSQLLGCIFQASVSNPSLPPSTPPIHLVPLPAVFQLQISSFNARASDFIIAGNCTAAQLLEQPIKAHTSLGFLALFVQSLGEALSLLSILVAFVGSAVMCSRRFKQHWLLLNGTLGEIHKPKRVL